jgi:hypothetical protein
VLDAKDRVYCVWVAFEGGSHTAEVVNGCSVSPRDGVGGNKGRMLVVAVRTVSIGPGFSVDVGVRHCWAGRRA